MLLFGLAVSGLIAGVLKGVAHELLDRSLLEAGVLNIR